MKNKWKDILFGGREAGVIMGDYKIYLVHIIRDRKHAERQKKTHAFRS